MPSQLFRDWLAGQNDAPDFPIALLTITSPTISVPIRLNSTTHQTITSRGNVYTKAGFDFVIPSRPSEGETRSQLVFVPHPEVLRQLRDHPGELTMVLEIVLDTTRDIVELGPYNMTDRGGRDYDSSTQVLIINCAFGDQLTYPRPALRYTPGVVPGLFGKSNLE